MSCGCLASCPSSATVRIHAHAAAATGGHTSRVRRQWKLNSVGRGCGRSWQEDLRKGKEQKEHEEDDGCEDDPSTIDIPVAASVVAGTGAIALSTEVILN